MDNPSTKTGHTTPQAPAPRRPWGVFLYVSAAFLYWASLYLYVPTLPTYVQTKVDSLAVVGVVLSMYGLWQAFIRLPLGIAADWLGRRKPFIIGCLILGGLGSWLLAVADGQTGLLVGRAITGLAAGTWVPLLVVFSSMYAPNQAVRATAMLTLVSSLARVSATGVTGLLNVWGGYSLAFFLAAGAALLAAVLIVPAPEQVRVPQRPSVRGLGRLMIRRDVLLPSILSALIMYADFAASFGFVPILSRQLGGADMTQSFLLSMHMAVIILGNLVASTVAQRIGARRLVYSAIGLLGLGLGLAAFAPSLWILFVAQFFLGLSWGVNYPVLMGLSIQYVDEGERTTAMGLHQSVYAIGMFAGPWLSGLLADAIGIQPMFGVTALACLVGGGLLTSRL